MKKFFLLPVIIFTFFGFSSCGDIAITSDICSVATEIVFYVQKICEFFPAETLDKTSKVSIQKQLIETTNHLKFLYSGLNTLEKNYNPKTEKYYLEELLKIRDQLKELYDSKSIDSVR